MAKYGFISFSSLLFLLLSGFTITASSAPIGINYGQIADNLPSPESVVPLLRSIGVGKVKLYDADPRVLRAFADTGIEFVVGLANDCLSKVRDPSKAVNWIKSNVVPYLPATKITSITVGNEILTSNDTAMIENLLPAMKGMQSALQTLGLSKQITITTAHSLAVLETSYPPSAGSFRSNMVPYISPILNFHAKTGSQFLINAYPYFAYKANPKQVQLDFVLFQPNRGVIDPVSNLKYDNMLFAQIDAVYAALATLGYGRLRLQISETGWPSKGDENEAGATLENARKYNGNLMRVMMEKKGTPMRPKDELDVYVFALFNENLKPGPASERNYGLFKPDGTPAYQLGIGAVNGSSSSDGNGGSGGDVGVGAVTPSPEGTTTGYFTISAAEGKLRFGGVGLCLQQGVPWACLSLILLLF
ncbi:glucan endo-1,3-beta-glucosidase 11 [Magnolia sinica]|uniref:glucan endo-1,3-beta-glucosidase 11 n=1 Tax=Magnolia sinica TaxID=86752 RepID=UPI00265A7824|nr:glucan endo-1,3-beta-glucosidase 11 [Magnolia sinica]